MYDMYSQEFTLCYWLVKSVLHNFGYVTSQLRYSFVVHPLLREILDPPLAGMVLFQVKV